MSSSNCSSRRWISRYILSNTGNFSAGVAFLYEAGLLPEGFSDSFRSVVATVILACEKFSNCKD